MATVSLYLRIRTWWLG